MMIRIAVVSDGHRYLNGIISTLIKDSFYLMITVFQPINHDEKRRLIEND